MAVKVEEEAEVLLSKKKTKRERCQMMIGGTKPGLMSGAIQMKNNSLMAMGIQVTIGTGMHGMRALSP